MPPSLTLQTIDTRQDNVQTRLDELRRKLSPQGQVVSERGRELTVEVFGQPLTPLQVVERICQDVRRDGLTALLDYTDKLDRVRLVASSLRVSESELQQAHAQAEPEFLETVRRIRDHVLEFQRALLNQDVTVTRSEGVTLRQRYSPLERVGICVPGGAAAYPSTVLMAGVPALAAGVKEIAVVAPPNDFGANNPDVLATCHELGIREVYRAGGAQAVAAMAYGVEGLPAVDKIVGPGNTFVQLAKKFVFGQVDIDSIAGPSEVVVIADPSTRPDFAAADMLAQAEHAPGASILITWDEATLQATLHAIQQRVSALSRSDVTVQSLVEFGALILTRDAAEACRITNQIAPEHVHIAIDDAESLLPQLTSAGATFLGHFSPVAVGDYVAGPSHVLPTGGTARWASGLTANDFLRSSSMIRYTREALQHDAVHVQRMADKEGLTAHRASIDIRLREPS